MSEESTKAEMARREAEIRAAMPPTIPIGVTPAEAALIADIHVALPNLEAAIDERIRQLTPSGAIVGPILTMLGLGEHACVDATSVRYTGTTLYFAVDLALLPDGDAPAVCGMIKADIERAIARRP